ncbi:hypothetical protein [Streptomyces sp. Wh19]|uniref:hypothetical protein n=1 Tax=Streptomyces sp. Wh19 TaxID=3076629 RepID=UPI002958516D|nr:hypothetical protein [Streptomyces sp. Wh19]MDV9195401.1 hypothetical protein [Streptomyces sp. Wh19]
MAQRFQPSAFFHAESHVLSSLPGLWSALVPSIGRGRPERLELLPGSTNGPSRFAPERTRGSWAMVAAALAPPRECPAIPTLFLSTAGLPVPSAAGAMTEARRDELDAIDPGWCPVWDTGWQRYYRLVQNHVQAGGTLPTTEGDVVVQGEDLGR